MNIPSARDPRFPEVQGLGALVEVYPMPVGSPQHAAWKWGLTAVALVTCLGWWVIAALHWPAISVTIAALALMSVLVPISARWAKRSAERAAREPYLPGAIAVFEQGLAIYDGGNKKPVAQFRWESISNVQIVPNDDNKPDYLWLTTRDGRGRGLYAHGSQQNAEIVAAVRAAINAAVVGSRVPRS